jgi:hypothetical protein
MRNSKYLYIYRCKPNYPTISKAFVIFQHSEAPSNHGNLLIIGRKLAEEECCVYAGQLESLELLGTFYCERSTNKTVIHCETGEY